MEEKNFAALMEFLRFLEDEDIKGASPQASMAKLAVKAEPELTEGQRAALAKEFPGLKGP